MIYIKKLPDREKDPENCCASKKEDRRYVDPVNIKNKQLYIYYSGYKI